MVRKEYRFRVFENRTLAKIFGPKMEKVIVDCRELHNEELHGWYCSPNVTGGDQIMKYVSSEVCCKYG
jgi:hypothetical protein